MSQSNRMDRNDAPNKGDKNQEPKKKRHTGRNITIGVIVALLLSTGGYYGLGPGQGNLPFIGGNDSQKEAPANNEQSEAQQSSTGEDATSSNAIGEGGSGNSKEEIAQAEDGVFLITVSEDKIIVDGRAMDEKTLEDYLSETFVTGDKAAENLQELSIKVKDDKAIKSTYDAVIAILNKMDLSFTEENEN